MASTLKTLPDKAKRQLLITGFDAFGKLTSNPSSRLVSLLSHEVPGLSSATLPTSYERAWQSMELLLREDPRVILMFGFSRHARGLRLERYARNRDGSDELDNDGLRGNTTIDEREPDVLPARAPVDELHQQLLDANVPAHVSEDAGGYVCNHTYFLTLQAANQQMPPETKCLFVHVGDWEAEIDRPDILRGAKLLIDLLAAEPAVFAERSPARA